MINAKEGGSIVRCLFRAFTLPYRCRPFGGYRLWTAPRICHRGEPHGVDVYDMAMTPSMRKWQYPQSLYNFYRWTGEEYSNYAGEITSDISEQKVSDLRYVWKLYHARF